jgi:hypothetical protein
MLFGLFKLFKNKSTELPSFTLTPSPPLPIVSPWIRFKDQKPPHEVVLGACDTYDCGWSIDTVWWHENQQCWMSTGGRSEKAHLHYTHWRHLPDPPPDSERHWV